MAFVVEEDVTLDPVNVALFCAMGMMFALNGLANLVKEFLGTLFHRDAPAKS